MAITFMGGTFQAITAFIFFHTNNKLGKEMRADLFKEIMSKDIQFFDSRKTGDIMSRLNGDVQAIQEALSNNFNQLVRSVILCILILAIVIYISWQMTVFFLCIMMPFNCFIPIYGSIIAKIRKTISDKAALQTETAQESFSNIRTIKAFASEDIQSVEFFNRNMEVFKYQKI